MVNRTNEFKIKFGQFFTKKNIWLEEQIREFIINSTCKIAYDPFAGRGDILEQMKSLGFVKTIGLDLDPSLRWNINDSLISIPHIDNAIIVTNPPYLAKQRAKRKKINLSKYFCTCPYNNLYLIALEKMLFAQKNVVAIIPESFINSNFRYKSLLFSITIIERNPFNDTSVPICVVCFDGVKKPYSEIKIYKNGKLFSNLEKIYKMRIFPKRNVKICFNKKSGWLALRAIDLTSSRDLIKFDHKKKH